MQRTPTITLMLAAAVLALTASLALLAAVWFMVSRLLMPNLIVPTSWVGFAGV